jgi:DNA-binding NarL/FixJ family response regulator
MVVQYFRTQAVFRRGRIVKDSQQLQKSSKNSLFQAELRFGMISASGRLVSANIIYERINTEEHSEIPTASTIRIWHVDDNQEVRQVIGEALQTQPGFVVERQFAFADATVRALKGCTNPPDVILLDLNLGEECGLDAIKPLLSVCPKVRVLMFTTFSDLMSEVHAMEGGATGFLLKSYPLTEITRLIRLATEDPHNPALFPLASLSAGTRAALKKEHPGRRGKHRESGFLGTLGSFWRWRHRTVFE